MSLVSCAAWQTQMNCLSSDLEDEFTRISTKLHEMTERSGEIGKQLADYNSSFNIARNANLESKNMLNNPYIASGQNQGYVQHYQEQYFASSEDLFGLNEIIKSLETEKEAIGVEEKSLMAQKNNLETRKKLADQDGQTAQQLKDKAIERFKINV